MSKNIGSGIFMLILSAAYYYAADSMPSSILDTTVPSSAFPKLLAITGGVLSLLLIGQSLVVRWIAGPAAAADNPGSSQRSWHEHRCALGLLVIVLLFVAALEVVGYPVAIAALILVVSIYQGYPLSKTSVAIAIAGGVLFWLFFMVLLGIHMPLGIWPRLLAGTPLTLPFA